MPLNWDYDWRFVVDNLMKAWSQMGIYIHIYRKGDTPVDVRIMTPENRIVDFF
jgi:hypothetical protein